MNAALNGLGAQVFGWFGQLSVELGVLALVVLAAGRLLPIKSPALRHLLWVVVLLKPLVAVAVSSPFTLFTPFAPLVPLAESGRDALATLPFEPPVHAAAFPIVATNSVGLTAAGWGAILWIAGAALLIGRIMIGQGILWRLRRQAQVQRGGPLFDALRQARQAFDRYPRVEVATSSSIGSPIALGILRPIIIFPADLVDKLRADELSLILMHEMAHVRRCDNLVLLLHRLVAAALFFHPAVWLCGRMLRREAEQACDDLVVCATGREKAYARGLAQVAERGSRFNLLIRRIPTMNAFAAAESDLALRIRRTLAGGARRMGTRARLLAAVLLGPLMVVTLPSCGTTGKRTGGDMAAEKVLAKESRDDEIWREAMATDPDEWSEELRLRFLSTIPDSTFQKEAMLRSLFTREIPAIMEEKRIWQEAMASDQGEWSDDLKTQLLAINPASTLEEVVEEVLRRRVWGEVMANDPGEWSEELKTQLLELKPGSTIEEIAKEISKLRSWREEGWPPIDSAKWPEEMKAQILGRKASEKVIIVLDQDGNWTTLRSSSKEASAPDTVRSSRSWNSDHGVLGIGDSLKLDVTLGGASTVLSGRDNDYQQLFSMRSLRQVGLVDQVIATEQQTEANAAARESEENRIIQELKTREREKTWEQAEVIDPDEWSEELKAQLLKFNPDRTIEEIAKEIRKRMLWRKVLKTAALTDPDEWSDELKTQLLARWPDSTIEEIAKRVHKRQETAALYIVLDQDGTMTLKDDESVTFAVTFATLKEELQAKRQLHDNTETIVIVIQGDEGALHGQIVQIMEIARQAGLVDQVIATDVTETSN